MTAYDVVNGDRIFVSETVTIRINVNNVDEPPYFISPPYYVQDIYEPAVCYCCYFFHCNSVAVRDPIVVENYHRTQKHLSFLF